MTHSSITVSLGEVSRPFYFRSGTCDEEVVQQILIRQEYDLKKLKRFQDLAAYVRKGKRSGLSTLIIDAGANIGAATAYFALNFPASRVVALEPDKDNFELLEKNTAGLRVDALRVGIASELGFLAVLDEREESWALRTTPVNGSEGTIPALTVNSLYQQYGQDCFPFIVKIDIEGGEKELFSQNLQWVAATPLIIMELHDWRFPGEGVSAPFLKYIATLDRDFVIIGENVYSIDNRL